jgi:integrase
VVFTPAQMRKLLSKATPEMIPFIALGGFASLRPHEIQRLDWEAIRFSPKRERRIEVKASKAKTGSRRLAPLPDNLVAWLKPLVSTGLVLHKLEVYRDVTALASELEIEWSQDVLRHSAISYWVALTGDVPRVALESGNSPKVIFKHYYQLVTKTTAQEWFSIRPKSSSSI